MEEAQEPRRRLVVEEHRNPAAAGKLWPSIITLLNCAVGAGVLSLPFAFRQTGFFGGLLLTLSVALIESFTLYVLSRWAEHTQSSNYSELVRKMLGPRTGFIMGLILFFYIWGSSSAYLIILGDCFQPLLASMLGEASWLAQRDAVIGLISTVFILPLCFPRTLTALAGVSALTLWGLFVVVGVIVFRSVQLLRAAEDPWADTQAFSLSWRFWEAVPIIVFGFQCHTNVIAVFDELQDGDAPRLLLPLTGRSSGDSTPAQQTPDGSTVELPHANGGIGHRQRQQQQQQQQWGQEPGQGAYTELPVPLLGKSRRRLKSRKLQGMVRVVLSAIGITSFFYCTVGLAGYLAFPTTVHSNILTNFPSSDKLIQVARAVVGVIQIASYPVLHNPARAAVRDLLAQLTGLHFGGTGFHVTETLLFFFSTLAVALSVTDLGVVFRLMGGTGGGLLIFCFPGLLLMQYAVGKHVLSKRRLSQVAAPLLAGGGGGGAGEGGEEEGGGLGQGQGRGAGMGSDEEEGGGELVAGGLQRGARGEAARRAQLQWQWQLRSGGGSAGSKGVVYNYWASKLFWAGAVLVLLSLLLCGGTVWMVLAAPAE